MIVTFDFDLTLSFPTPDGISYDEWQQMPPDQTSNVEFVNKLKEHLKDGDEVHIVTSRNESLFSRHNIKTFLHKHIGKLIPVWHTDGKLKVKTLQIVKSQLHYDDDPEELAAARKAGIVAINAFNRSAEEAYQRWFESL